MLGKNKGLDAAGSLAIVNRLSALLVESETSTPKALLDINMLLQAAKLLTPVSYHGERNMFINVFLQQ